MEALEKQLPLSLGFQLSASLLNCNPWKKGTAPDHAEMEPHEVLIPGPGSGLVCLSYPVPTY